MEKDWSKVEGTLRVWVDEHEDELVSLVEELVRFPSVSEPLDAGSPHPFGGACAQMADATKDIVERLGLAWENHEYYAISAAYRGGNEDGGVASGGAGAARFSRPRIAFFSHLDVVPAQPRGWNNPPFEPYVRDGYIYGRGTSDNKGPFASVLLALRFLAEHGIELDHDVILYGGFNEEGAMDDAKWLAEHEPLPEVSLVSDCYFPVCVAEKSIVQVEAWARLDDPALLDLEAGEAHNIVPSHAKAVVLGEDGEKLVETTGIPAHVAFPEGSKNALVELVAQLAHCMSLEQKTRGVFGFIARGFAAFDGSGLGIDLHDGFLGDATVVPTEANYDGGVLRLSINARYPDVEGGERVSAALRSALEGAGFAIALLEESPGRSTSADDPKVALLTSIVNDELGTTLKPYAMGGATHARWIPDALGFGPGRRDVALPAGVGSGHQVNEAVSIEQLKQAIAIYVRAILTLDGGGNHLR